MAGRGWLRDTVRRAFQAVLRRRYESQTGGSADLDKAFYQALERLYARTAEELGLSVSRLGQLLCISDGRRSYRIYKSWTDLNPPSCGVISGDKGLTRRLLEEAGLCIPPGAVFAAAEAERAAAFALARGGEWVVKPAYGTADCKGVSLRLRSGKEILRAVGKSALYCPEFLIERWVPGDNYRALIYRGRCLSLLHRKRPHLVGNGVDSVRALIEQENAARKNRRLWLGPEFHYRPLEARLAKRTLARQGLKLSSVPADGEEVELGDWPLYSIGGTFYEVLERAHPLIHQAAVKAAEVIGLQLAGVDIISADLHGGSYSVNEVNSNPAIFIHYLVEGDCPQNHPIREIFEDYFRL